jgi:dTDP-N-acetylfucosamine:lipid II N-acetylfucosaminyltransferase
MSKLKLLHLIHDEKFLDATFDLFEKTGHENHFVFIGRPRQLKYIKKKHLVEFIPKGGRSYRKLIETNYDALFIHYFQRRYINLVIHFKDKTKIIWNTWGGDFYNLIKFPIYQPITRKIKASAENGDPDCGFLSNLTARIAWSVSRCSKKIKLKFSGICANQFNAISCIDYCSAVIPLEYDLLKTIPGFTAQQVLFNYPLSPGFDLDHSTSNELGPNILIGNSYTWSGNHADAFEKIKGVSLEGRKIIAPLSYGIDFRKHTWLIELGYSYFGGSFVPITEFIPFEQYKSLINSCSVCVFNSERQQALGNIILAMINGAKIFLSENSPTYKFFKSKGLHVFSVQADLNHQQINLPLTSEEREINRFYVKNEWGHASLLKKTEALLDQVIHQ